MTRGLLVALEGGPGAPVGRQATLLCRHLDVVGIPVQLADPRESCVREDTLLAVDRRSYAGRLTPLLCRLARTADVATRQIVPQVDMGHVVVVERYRLTLLAHGVARGLDAAWLEALAAALPRADVSLYLRCAPERQFRRLLEQGEPIEGWESGVDLARAAGLAAAFRSYQSRVGRAFDDRCGGADLEAMDADAAETAVELRIRERVLAALGAAE